MDGSKGSESQGDLAESQADGRHTAVSTNGEQATDGEEEEAVLSRGGGSNRRDEGTAASTSSST